MPITVTNGHTGWDCPEGASLIIEATSPGAGTLPHLHGVVYACERHQEAAQERITAVGYTPLTHTAPASHRWNPWPCGHTTTYDDQAASRLGPAPAVAGFDAAY